MTNPARGFVSSANQVPADTAYPYYLNGNYPMYRGLLINKMLSHMDSITPHKMMELQTSTYDLFAEMAKPLLLRNIVESGLSGDEKNYLNLSNT